MSRLLPPRAIAINGRNDTNSYSRSERVYRVCADLIMGTCFDSADSLPSEKPKKHSFTQRDLEVKVSEALAHLPWKIDLLLTRRYGLSGMTSPRSIEESARESRCSIETFKAEEDNALRLLAGYGKKK